MKRENSHVYANATSVVVLVLMLIAVGLEDSRQPRETKTAGADYEGGAAPLERISTDAVWRGAELKMEYERHSLRSVIDGEWVHIETMDDVLVTCFPSYSFPADEWRSKPGKIYISLAMNDGRETPENVALVLAGVWSVNEVPLACESTIDGEASPADDWIVERIMAPGIRSVNPSAITPGSR